MSTFDDALTEPASAKLVFADVDLRKHFYGWSASGGAWRQASAETVTAMNENDAVMNEESSLANLLAASTASVGAFFYDAVNLFLYAKPKTSTTVYENFYVATVNFVWSKDGATQNSIIREARILQAPSQSIRTSNLFDGKLAQIGAGSMNMQDADALFARTDLEPDGQAELIASFEVIT